MLLLADVFLGATALSVLFLIIGLFKPWAMLWWEDRQNRKKVIKVYGTVAVLLFLIYQLVSISSP